MMKKLGESVESVSMQEQKSIERREGNIIPHPKYKIGDTIVYKNSGTFYATYFVLAIIKAGYYYAEKKEWFYCIDLPGNPLFGEYVRDMKESEIVKV